MTTYFEWLFEQPILNAQPKLVPAAIRTRSGLAISLIATADEVIE